MSKCQRCGDILPPQAIMCPRCGAPVPDQRWGQLPAGSAGGFGQGANGVNAGMGQSSPAAPPMQFSAGDLISPENLPSWMRQGAEGMNGGGWPPASQPHAPQASAAPQAPSAGGWGPPPGAWQGAPLESMQTVRQPIVGPMGAGSVNQPAPQEYPPAEWRQPPQNPPAPYDQRYAPPPVAPAPQPLPVFPGHPGYPNGAQSVQPGYGAYAQEAYQQPPAPLQSIPAQPGFVPPSAFPPVEQAGMYAPPPQAPGMGARGLVDQTALPSWLAGAAPQGQPQGQSLGMQARSLVDEQALPEWLRQQPDERPRPSVAGWIGASAAEEPLPSWMTPGAPETASGYNQPGATPFGGQPINGYAAPQAAPNGYAAPPAQINGFAGSAPPAPVNGYAPQTPINGYAPPAPVNGYMPQAPAPSVPNAWQQPPPASAQMQAYGSAAQPGAEDIALPDWLQAQAGANGAMTSAQEATPSPYPQYQWDEAPAFDERPQASPYPFSSSGDGDAAPIMRTPNASPWDNEPLMDTPETGGIEGDQGWDAPASWDDRQASPSTDNWGELDGRRVTRGAPLAPEEMPPWLRRPTEYGGGRSGFSGMDHAEYGRIGNARDAASQRGPRRDPDGWGDEREWDDGSGDWDGQRGGYDERDRNSWGHGNSSDPGRDPRHPRDEWDSSSYEPDANAARYSRGNNGGERRGPPAPGYGASADPYADPYANQRRGYDMPGSRDPYMETGYSEYDGAAGSYDESDDEDDSSARKRKGWRGFFRRGE